MSDPLQQDLRSALSLLTPMKVHGARKIRVGGAADGGYIMSDDMPQRPVCYSFGVGPDVSWDIEMATLHGAVVHQYDHTVDRAPSEHPNCHFNKIGLGDHDDFPELRRLDTLIRANGDDTHDELILKCDIEGAEWLALSVLPREFFRRFDQVVMELHWLDHLSDRNFRRTWRLLFENITATHQCFHIHANNYSQMVVVQGIPIPQVVEVSFARRERRTFSTNEEMSPGPLDSPNRPDVPDLFLGLFRF